MNVRESIGAIGMFPVTSADQSSPQASISVSRVILSLSPFRWFSWSVLQVEEGQVVLVACLRDSQRSHCDIYPHRVVPCFLGKFLLLNDSVAHVSWVFIEAAVRVNQGVMPLGSFVDVSEFAVLHEVVTAMKKWVRRSSRGSRQIHRSHCPNGSSSHGCPKGTNVQRHKPLDGQ